MNKYKCKVCGYIVEGETPPDVCPMCHAAASEFELIESGGDSAADGKPAASKGLNRNSNLYTIVYASVMVVLVAVVLAFTSESLRSYQKKNQDNDKRQQILRSINVSVPLSQTEAEYGKLIKEAYLVDAQGNKVEGDAFAADASKMSHEGKYPVFVASIDGQTKYIMALYGAGLWGPIWGYVSVNDDRNTIFGADFSHQGETPGLGAEIATTHFRGQFAGKQLFKAGAFRSIAIVKPGKTADNQDYVDGISGGTITSKGVDHMLAASLSQYAPYLQK